jgi:nicotinamide-nucleotide amidase
MIDPAMEQLAASVGARLAARGMLLATAESCTGGWLAEAVTAIAGSSGWFDRGFVTYSNAAKESMLGVSAATLSAHGAVSLEVAREMAAGALAHSQAQVAVSITGVAGPGGGTPAKPVGMVCIGWALAGGQVEARVHHFAGDRGEVRRQSVVSALEGVLAVVGNPV